MKPILTLTVSLLFLPLVYWGMMVFLRPSFKDEKNKTGSLALTPAGALVAAVSELALVRVWFARGRCDYTDMMFILIVIMLTAMSVFCITDLYERIVPNKLLLILLMLYVITLGLFGVYDMSILIETLPSIILGFIFCAASFGLAYLLAHKNLGAGDVKLSLVMGLYLTGEYVVGAVMYGCIVGALFGIVQLIRKKMTRKDLMPFVPFLYIGLIIRCFIG